MPFLKTNGPAGCHLLHVAGIQQPRMLPAGEADVPDEAGVIGVQAGGQWRAYLVGAMSGMDSHVVNDLVGDMPLSVTYCDQTDCARVLTSPERGGSIDLWTGGWMNGRMALRLNEQMYLQSSPDLPLDDLPFERVTWAEWKAAHPDTVIFVGNPETRGQETGDKNQGSGGRAQ